MKLSAMVFTLLVGAGICADCKTTESIPVDATCEDFYVGPVLPDDFEFPELIGGMTALQRKVRYPREARRDRIQGEVPVSFIINKRGQPTQLELVRSLTRALDEEAQRVIRQAKFEPARVDGEPVCMKMALPITFRLQR